MLAFAASDMKTDGTNANTSHLFLIDQYKETTSTYRYLCGWQRDPLPPGMKDQWIADLKDSQGNIIEYAYTNEIIETQPTSQKISMNWGESGSFDNTLYSPMSSWIVDDDIFNLNHYIYLRSN